MQENSSTQRHIRSPETYSGLGSQPAPWLTAGDPSPGVAPGLAPGRELLTWEDQVPNLAVALAIRLHRKRAFYTLSKRLLDIIGSLFLLTLTMPVFVVVAALIRLTSPGPIFFRHKRIGRDGKEFWCFKFRTMVADAEEQLKRLPDLRQQFEQNFKLQSDPRVTPLGALLRRTSIDELPQLFQVLRGEMSLIGPRPVVREELLKYGVYRHKLLTVKPGLSGVWQTCGRSDTTYEERVQMDMSYVDHRCLSLDILLLCLTVLAVLRKKGAC